MRAIAVFLLLTAALFARPASAYDANDPANCIRPDWDDAKPLTVAGWSVLPESSSPARSKLRS